MSASMHSSPLIRDEGQVPLFQEAFMIPSHSLFDAHWRWLSLLTLALLSGCASGLRSDQHGDAGGAPHA